MKLQKGRLERFLDSHLKSEIKDIEISNIPSLSQLGRKFGNVDPKTISQFIKDQYLIRKYGSERTKSIYNKCWGSRNPRKNIDEKKELFSVYMREIMNLYKEGKELPNDIGVRSLARKFNVNRMTIPNWIKKFINQWLINEFQINSDNIELDKSTNDIYDEIWGIRCNKIRKIKFEEIEKIILKRGGILLTSKTEFDSLEEIPTERYIKVKCGKNHIFQIKIRCLIYDYNWCSTCNEYICEKILRYYMNNLFNTQFNPQVRLSKALKISIKNKITQNISFNDKKYDITVHVGRQRYDCFVSNLKLKGKDGKIYTLMIAGEYDGIQHSEEDPIKNPYCRNEYEIARTKARDLAKNKISAENTIILIRIKEFKGFNRRVMIYKQGLVLKEITKQFNSQFNTIYGHNNLRLKFNPNKMVNPLGIKSLYERRGPIQKFL